MKNKKAYILTLIIISSILTINYTIQKTGESELLIKFKPGVSEQPKTEILTSLGLEVKGEIPEIQTLVVSAPQNTLNHIKTTLKQNPMIDLVEENQKIPLTQTPNDKYYNLQWHLQKVQTLDAWDISQGEPNIIIAVLDTGVDPNHPDLAGKLLEGYNAYDDSNNATGDLAHGTAVAGTIAATTNNTLGVSAIAWKNMILPIKVNPPGQGYTTFSLLAKGLIYAADKGAKVACISWQIFNGATLTSAAKYFMDKGGLVIAAAGNTGKLENYTDNPYIITVSATNKTDGITSWSSFGPYVDLSAPGSGIFTLVPGWQATSYDYAYGYWSGTSFSTPIVAGLAALIFSANPTLTPQQVEQILKSTAVDLGEPGYDILYGWGRINASKALAAAVGMSPPPPDTTPPTVTITYPDNGATISGAITIKVQADDDTAVTKVELYINGTLYATDTEAPYEFHWDTTIETNGIYTLQAKAYDKAGNIGESNTITVTINNIIDTKPPTLNILQPQNGSTASKTVEIRAEATDESGISRVEFYIDNKLAATVSAEPYTYQWNTKKAKNGWHTITVKAYDRSGNTAQTTIKVYVSNNK